VPRAKFGAFVRHVTKIPLSHPTISDRWFLVLLVIDVHCWDGRVVCVQLQK